MLLEIDLHVAVNVVGFSIDLLMVLCFGVEIVDDVYM